MPVLASGQPAKAITWFRDATAEYGAVGSGPAALVDLDGDGFPELICEGRLFKNENGKRFVDVTKAAGIAATGTACVADIDTTGQPGRVGLPAPS